MDTNQADRPRRERNASGAEHQYSRRSLMKGSLAIGSVLVGSAHLHTRMADAAFQTPTVGGTIIIAAGGDPSFDPYFLNSELRDVQSQIFRALFDYRGDDPYEVNPALAESWEETDDTLTVKLKEGVLFQNGREVVAQDVLDNVARAKNEALGHNLSAIFGPSVASVEAIDDHTVKFTYAATYPTKREDLVYLYLIPKEAMETVATNPVGCGPFSFVSYAPGDKLEMSRFEGFYEVGLPYLDHVTVQIIPDPQAQLANLRSGAIDFVGSLPLADLSILEADSNLQVLRYPIGGVWQCILLNTKQTPLDQQVVRQALNYSVDREKIVQFAYFGELQPTQTRYLPEIFWFNQDAEDFYSFDLDKAKDLLSQAGVGDGFELSISIAPDVILGSKEMAQVWQQDLAQLGIDAKIEEKEQALFFDDYFSGNFQAIAYTLGDGTIDPAIYLANNSPLRTENNTCGIETQDFFEEYAQLIKDGSSTIDRDARKQTYDRLQLLSAEQGWVINLSFNQDALALSPRVENYQTDITEFTQLDGVWLSS